MSSFEVHPDTRRALGFRVATPGAAGLDFQPDLHGEGAEIAATTEASVGAREQAAYERGVADGRAELPWDDAEALRGAIAACSTLSSKLEDERSRLRTLTLGAVVDLARTIAERWVRESLVAAPAALAGLLERAVAQLTEPSEIVVRLHPDDLAALQLAEPAWGDDAARRMTFEPDPNLLRGDALVRADAERLDARIGPTMQDLRDALETELWNEEGSE